MFSRLSPSALRRRPSGSMIAPPMHEPPRVSRAEEPRRSRSASRSRRSSPRPAAARIRRPAIAAAVARKVPQDLGRQAFARERDDSPAPVRPGGPAAGSRAVDEILWETRRYRESVSSAGLTTIRGIESGKAYFTDQDGVTRVVSDQVLRELTTRSYFWRRAWLFEERERAWLDLGPARTRRPSRSSLRPEGGNPLTLTFSRARRPAPRGALAAVRPRVHVAPGLPRRLRSAPTRSTARSPGSACRRARSPRRTSAAASARFGAAAADGAPFERRSGALIVPGDRLGGSRSASRSTPPRTARSSCRPSSRRRLGLVFAPDVFGRFVAPGASLEVAGVVVPVAVGPAIARAAARRGRRDRRRLPLPRGGRRVRPGGRPRCASTTRRRGPRRRATSAIVIDDDDDRPVAILNRGKSEAARWRPAATRARPRSSWPRRAPSAKGWRARTRPTGFTWGLIHLPPLPIDDRAGRLLSRLGRRRPARLRGPPAVSRLREHAASAGST